jgi:hypothetical protein
MHTAPTSGADGKSLVWFEDCGGRESGPDDSRVSAWTMTLSTCWLMSSWSRMSLPVWAVSWLVGSTSLRAAPRFCCGTAPPCRDGLAGPVHFCADIAAPSPFSGTLCRSFLRPPLAPAIMLDLIGETRMTGAIWSLARQFLRSAETKFRLCRIPDRPTAHRLA